MQVFNQSSRTNNAAKVASIGTIANIAKVLFGFFYRSLFLYILSAEYLGINGLFSNILQILSLAELGITTAIVYRFYEPISRNDVHYVGMLMNFFKRVYLVIAAVILTLGLMLLPFIKFLIKDSSEVPADVNLYVVYVLFLLNTVSTYIFAYKLSLLTADQKGYITTIVDLINTFVAYAVQIAVLLLTHNYTLTLALSIASTLTINYISSVWVTKNYKPVFEVKEMLPKDEQKKIFHDTRACMYHKVGTTVLTGTDNAILTKMVSLTATGLYSNYAMIVTYLQNILSQILGNFTASVGNARNTVTSDEYYSLYKKMNFIGLWTSCMCATCLFTVFDDFIGVWLGEKFVFDKLTTAIICIQMYLSATRIMNGAFTNADGLFVKDKIRPLIESVINLVVSIYLTYKMGIAGVFLGTIISNITTVCWREPLILYRYSFKRSVSEYWKVYAQFTTIALAVTAVLYLARIKLFTGTINLLGVFIEGVAAFVVVNAVMILIYHNTEEFKYSKELVVTYAKKFANKLRKKSV